MKNTNDFEKTELSYDSPIPLYYQIQQIIRESINSGELKPGDQILTEEKLQKKFEVSRATVRKAISELVYEGLLEKRASKGTIVAKPKIEEAMYGAHSFTNATLKKNKSLKTKIIEFKRISNNSSVNKKLNINKEDSLIYMKRVRYIDGSAICVEDWYAPYKYFPELNKSMFKEIGQEQSSYNVLKEKYNIEVKSVHDIMSAVALVKEDADLLNLYKNMPALLRQRISYDELDRPIVYSSGRYIIKIVIDFYSDNNKE